MTRRIIVAGGGTGGHLFPGLAVVEELRRRLEVDVLFVGTERGIESRLLPARGERLTTLDVTPLKGRSPSQLFKSLGRLPGSAFRAAQIVRGHRAELCIGVGGYASGPLLAAAAAVGVPTALLEQNAHVGLTNRMLASVVGRAYLSFDETRSSFGKGARVVGNPVRGDFRVWARRAAADPEGFEARARTVLVMGGSQGAQALNETVPAAFAHVELRGLKVVHQTGEAMREAVEARYRALGIDAEVVSFIDDMARAYASAALVVARAGATTLAELQAIGRASILVPYPHAADDHQTRNAEALERDGAARCVAQSSLEAESLGAMLNELLSDDAKRCAMSEAARRRGRPDAAASIVDDLCAWLGWHEASARASVPPSATGSADESETDSEDDGDPGMGLRGDTFYSPRRSTLPPPSARRRLVFEDSKTLWD